MSLVRENIGKRLFGVELGWPGLCHVGKAQSVFLLADLGQHGGANCLRLRLLDRGWSSVMYRRDLDGAIELSPQDERAEVPGIAVCSPDDEFGWLHPASAHPFVLDGQYWRTAHPRDWPWPLAKVAQSQPTGDLYQAPESVTSNSPKFQSDRNHIGGTHFPA